MRNISQTAVGANAAAALGESAMWVDSSLAFASDAHADDCVLLGSRSVRGSLGYRLMEYSS